MAYPTGRALERYRALQVGTADPAQLLLLLYEGALRFLGQAEQALAAQRSWQAHDSLVRAEKILEELLDTLDPSKDPKLAQDLGRLYDYCWRRLLEADLRADAGPIREVAALLRNLLEGWRQVIAPRSP